MPKVTIVTVEGEAEELRDIVRGLLGPDADQLLAPARLRNGQPQPAEDGWSEEELETLWREVSPNVHPIWAEVASRPEGYPIDELRRKLGLEGPVMSGRLTAVGKALRRLKWKKSDPMRRDVRAGKYSMAAEVAEVIRRLAQEEQS